MIARIGTQRSVGAGGDAVTQTWRPRHAQFDDPRPGSRARAGADEPAYLLDPVKFLAEATWQRSLRPRDWVRMAAERGVLALPEPGAVPELTVEFECAQRLPQPWSNRPPELVELPECRLWCDELVRVGRDLVTVDGELMIGPAARPFEGELRLVQVSPRSVLLSLTGQCLAGDPGPDVFDGPILRGLVHGPDLRLEIAMEFIR